VGGKGVGIVAESDLSELVRPAEEFREHRPFLFSSDDVRAFRIEGSGIALHADREREGGGWSAREGGGPSLRAEGARIDEALDLIRWLRARRVTDAAGGDFVPALAIALDGERGPLGRLEIDRIPRSRPAAGASPGGEETLRLRSSARPGCVFEIPVTQLEGLPRAAADLAGPAAERKP
jgi:hypothetical protein